MVIRAQLWTLGSMDSQLASPWKGWSPKLLVLWPHVGQISPPIQASSSEVSVPCSEGGWFPASCRLCWWNSELQHPPWHNGGVPSA